LFPISLTLKTFPWYHGEEFIQAPAGGETRFYTFFCLIDSAMGMKINGHFLIEQPLKDSGQGIDVHGWKAAEDFRVGQLTESEANWTICRDWG
jgi:hypothetical protein